MQIKVHRGIIFISQTGNNPKSDNTLCWQVCRKKALLYPAGGRGNWRNSLEDNLTISVTAINLYTF